MSYTKQRAREYYYANRERILREGKEKIVCHCGCIVSKSSLLPHLQTSKHRNYLSLCRSKDYDTDDIIVCKRKKVKKPNERQEKPNFIVSFD